ncbi:MAG: DMT family transporter [Gammaproteobacteria bacterium]
MTPSVLALVLCAAVLHASWNALLKIGGDPLARLALINAAAALCALPIVLLAPAPAAASWPYLAGSVAIHQVYNLGLVFGYRYGDLSLVYPITRGVAPMLVAIGAYLFAGERLNLPGTLAVGFICAAILSLAFDKGWRLRSPKAVGFALLTGLMIAGYTVCDGLGGRLSGSAPGYSAWLFVLEAPPLALVALAWRPHAVLAVFAKHWRMGLLGGACAATAYGLVIWAMSLTPMTYVSALRETSVILAAWIGTRLLREPFGGRRMALASLVAVGVILLQYSRAG